MAALVAVPATAVPAAHAAFPGRNGVIAFNGERKVGGKVRQGVFAMYPGSRRVRPLIAESRSRGFPLNPHFSPGGRMLAFEYAGGLAPGPGEPDVWLRSVSRRSRPRPMIAKPAGTDFHFSPDRELADREPAWSPDGKSIVFARITAFIPPKDALDQTRFGPEDWRIYHHGHSRPLVNGGLEVNDAAWSVRNEIAFVRFGDDPEDPKIYVVRPDGTRERRLIRGWELDWSPDGRRLVFVTPGQQLATISRSGHGLRRLTHDPRCSISGPAFSPGGGQIAFFRVPEERCTSGGLTIMRTDGSHVRRLTGDDVVTNQQYLDWQPLRRRR